MWALLSVCVRLNLLLGRTISQLLGLYTEPTCNRASSHLVAKLCLKTLFKSSQDSSLLNHPDDFLATSFSIASGNSLMLVSKMSVIYKPRSYLKIIHAFKTVNYSSIYTTVN